MVISSWVKARITWWRK